MKRIALLMLVGCLGACDSNVSEPPPQPTQLTITIAGESAEAIGAALLSVEGGADQVVVGPGWGLTMAGDGETVIAAVLAVPSTSLEIELESTVGPTAAVELLQVADGLNSLFADAASFSVEVRESEDGP